MITYTTVETTLGRSLSDAEQAQAGLWISQALTIISSRLGDTTLLDQDVLAMVVTEAVANRIKRPDSATQISVSVDDGQVSRTYESSTGGIEILPEWWELLSPASAGAAFSVTPYYVAPDACR